MKVEIDPLSGFCFGVTSAIQMAEQELEKEHKLYCLGEIVHNQAEINRLNKMGMITIGKDDLISLKGKKVLVRAHGEPPATYEMAQEHHIKLIDATCPVVLKLQDRIRNAFVQMKKAGGQVVIYGKKGHAEVIGLLGQVNNQAVLIENFDDIKRIDPDKPVELFSQTTQDIEQFCKLTEAIKNYVHAEVIVHDTICRQVSNRVPELIKFAAKYEVIVFVSGKNSSNGRFLYQICKNHNKNTYLVSNVSDLEPSWFLNIKSVGISGATSTPRWIMQQVAEKIQSF